MAEENKEKKIEKEEVKKVEKAETKKEPKKEEKTVTESANKETNKEEKPKFEKVKKEENVVQNNQKNKKGKKEKAKNKTEKEGKKGLFARVLAIIIILLVIIGLIYLAIPTPEKSLNNMLKALKDGNIDKVNQYVSYDDISLSKAVGINEEASKENDAILFESLEWNIKSVKEENDIATIEIEVTNKDYETAFKNYIQTMFQKFINNEDVTEEEQFTLLLNELKSDSLGNKTVTETINLTKTDGAWKINADENLAKALYPGLEDGIDSISSFMSLND